MVTRSFVKQPLKARTNIDNTIYHVSTGSRQGDERERALNAIEKRSI